MANETYSNVGALNVEFSPETSQKQNKIDYNQQLKNEFCQIIDRLQLEENQRAYLRSRWLDQLLWMEGKASENRNWYRKLRFISIVLGIIVPILVTLDGNGVKLFDQFDAQPVLKGATILLSSIIAISTALEEFYQFGNRWYSYRKSSELLKTNGWQFFQLSGQYLQDNHQDALPAFIEQVESIVQRDVEIFSTEGLKEKQTSKEQAEQKKNAEDS